TKLGALAASVITSTSCHDIPAGARSALTNASLAANRPANESVSRWDSPAVNKRVRSVSCRSRVWVNRLRSTISTPIPYTLIPRSPISPDFGADQHRIQAGWPADTRRSATAPWSRGVVVASRLSEAGSLRRHGALRLHRRLLPIRSCRRRGPGFLGYC